MRTAIFICAIFIILHCRVFSQSEWIEQNSNTTNKLESVFFVDANTGYIVGGIFNPYTSSGIILKTTNSGENWIIQKTVYPALRKVFFVNANTGWIVGGSVMTLGFVNRIFMRTTNGGINWTEYDDPAFPKPLTSLCFINDQTGFVGSFNGNIFKTTNGGINFSQVYNKVCYAINFTDSLTGFFGGEVNIYRTTDAGNSWNLNYTNNTMNISEMFFLNKNIGMASGYGTVLKTINGGVNWSRIINDYTFRQEIFLVDSLEGWIAYGDRNALMKTTNGGVNWIDKYIPYVSYIGSVFFVNKCTGWVCGENGFIRKTVTGGEPVGIKKISDEIPPDFKLLQNFPNPFSRETNIKFEIPSWNSALPMLSNGTDNRDFLITLSVYDITGREVAVLFKRELHAGVYEVNFNAGNLNSGVYFCKLQAGKMSKVKRILLVK